MKFKGAFTDRGASLLEKAFLPTLEKFGKTCQVLLGNEEIKFVQTTVNTDGPHVAASLDADVLFEKSTLRCVSRHHNLIAFTLDVGLLLKVLRSASANDADAVEVKLAQKPVLVPGEEQPQNRPFLTFIARAAGCSLVQDLPISRPYQPYEIDKLSAASGSSELCEWYANLAPARPRLQAVVERMKSLSATLRLVLCKTGDVHLQAAATNVLMGSQFQTLMVLPAGAAVPVPEALRDAPAEQQLQAALDTGHAVSVQLLNKHLSRTLAVSQLSQPSQILCGVKENGAHVHVMYVFRDPESTAAFDESIQLSFKLPTMDEEE